VRRRALFALALAIPAAAQAQQQIAQGQTAQAFLEAIYRPYLAKDYKGTDYTRPERYFTADLAAAMQRDFDEAKRRNEVPLLNGDPFLDAQDWEISDLAVRVELTVAYVSFSNFGKPVQLGLRLTETSSGWRIRDIRGLQGSGASLRALYKLP
jgi:hypothetical protein